MKTRLRRKRLLKDKMLIIKVSFILLFTSFWRCKDSRQTKQRGGATSNKKLILMWKVLMFTRKTDRWYLDLSGEIWKGLASCAHICSCSYLLTNTRHLICKSLCACNSKGWIWSQKWDVLCKSPWLDIQLLMVVWMDGYLGWVWESDEETSSIKFSCFVMPLWCSSKSDSNYRQFHATP